MPALQGLRGKAGLTANMDVVTNGPEQIIEIQFHNSSLIGLKLC